MKNNLVDGVIKFSFSLKKTGPLAPELYLDLEKWRALFFRMNLIGEYQPEKVGFGNMSKRIAKGKTEFVITGSQTGHLPNLDGLQYTKVVKCNPEKMQIEAVGPLNPSSESITHWSLYHYDPQIGFIFHIHHKDLWKYLIDKGAYTSEDIAYGTADMAIAVSLLVSKGIKIFGMAGHEEGVIAVGSNADETGKLILDTLRISKNSEISGK